MWLNRFAFWLNLLTAAYIAVWGGGSVYYVLLFLFLALIQIPFMYREFR